MKSPRLFYLDETIGAFVPAPDRIENIIEVYDMDDGEEMTIEFICKHMTDEEYESLPEGNW